MKRLEILVILSIIFLAIGLRFSEVYFNNFLFMLDQGRDLLDVKRIIFDGHLTLIGPYTGLQGVFQGPLWYYLLGIPLFLTGGHPWGTVFLMFFMSMTVLVIVYYTAIKFLGYQTAILTLFLLAVSPEAIAAATYAWNPHPLWLLIAVYLYFFYKVIFGEKKYTVFLWIIMGLMFHFESAGGFFILLGTILFFFLFERKTILTKHFAIGFGCFLFLFLPQVLFDFRHDFLMTKSVLNIFQGSDQGLFADNERVSYFHIIRGHIDMIYYNFSSSFLRDGYLIYLPNIMLFVLFSALLFKKKLTLFSKRENVFLNQTIKLLFCILLLVVFFPFPVRYWYLTGYQLFYILISGLILSKLFSFPKGKLIILLFAGIILFYSIDKGVHLYTKPDYGGIAKIKGKLDAIKYVYNDAKGLSLNLLIFTPPIYTDAYDYLIWWYGKKTNQSMPSKEKKGIFYLLIEPDPNIPWSYKGWLETVIKTGKIVDEKTLPSGLIIQKRIEE